MKKLLLVLLVLSSLYMSTLFAVENTQKLGLSVNEEGILVKDGEPYYGIGANYFDMFYRLLKVEAKEYNNEEAKNHAIEQELNIIDNSLKILNDKNIPFVRFMCGGYWPSENALYVNKETREFYFELLDKIVALAEKNNIGLIPTLFWHKATVSDIVIEPVNQIGNPNSKTCDFIREYTKEIVLRYKNSPAMWGWQFGNEYSLTVDLPNAIDVLPSISVEHGTPSFRTEEDIITSDDLQNVYNVFVNEIKKHDTVHNRIILTGNCVPRPYAFNNSKYGTWTKDTREEFFKILDRDNQHTDTITVHLYPKSEKDGYSGVTDNLADLIGVTNNHAISVGKPMYIGEFGVNETWIKDSPGLFQEIVDSIIVNQVPISAFWVYDYSDQNGIWNITKDNERGYMLDIISKANEKLQKQ